MERARTKPGAKSMTLRIDRVQQRVRLSGEFRSEHVHQVKAELDRCQSPVALDLEEVGLVDVEAIRFSELVRGGGSFGATRLRLHQDVDVAGTRAVGRTAERERRTVMETKANVALVHGAWADGSSWSKVIPLLQKQNLNVVAAQLPLTSVEADIAVTKNLLGMLKGPVVLVGHSYGGVVISGAANGMPGVKTLVYIAAFALDEGESLDGLSKQGPAPGGAAAVRPPDDHGFLWIDRDGFAKAFAADVDPTEARVMAAVQKPLSVDSFTAKAGPPAWKTLPSWYMVATDDQMIPPQAEELMAKRMGAEIRRVASSHAAMVSHPKEVADFITLAANSVASA